MCNQLCGFKTFLLPSGEGSVFRPWICKISCRTACADSKDASSHCVLWSWQNSWPRARFSWLYSNCNTNLTGNWIGLLLQQELCHTSPDFISFLHSFTFCLTDVLPPCLPLVWTLLRACWGCWNAQKPVPKRGGCGAGRSGQPGSAGWGADWAVESSSAQPGCGLLLLQELLRSFGNVIPTEEIQCRKDRALLKAVLQRSVFIWWEEESVGLSITYLQ